MKKRYLIFIFFALILVTSGASCSFEDEAPLVVSDGGVYKSQDRGITWRQMVTVEPGSGRVDNIIVNDIIFDRKDYNIIYLISNRGVWLTIDGARNWKQIAKKKIYSFAIDHKNKGTNYIASGTRIFKTTDSGKHWPEVYSETRKVNFTSIHVDPFASEIIWASNSAGELLKSKDHGLSWRVSHNFGDAVKKIIMHPSDKNVAYVVTKKKGIFRTVDAGSTWTSLKKNYVKRPNGVDKKGKPLFTTRKGSGTFILLYFDPIQKKRLYYISKYGILRSNDRGDTWEDLTLVTKPSSVAINSFQVNKRNNRELFYTAKNILYHSTNYGVEWFTERVPTKRKLKSFLINPENPAIQYLGTEPPPPPPPKKKQFFFF